MQVAPSSYIRDSGTWSKIFAPLSSCDLADLSYGINDSVSRPTLTAGTGLLDTAEEVFVDIIDDAALVLDAPAMPPDILDVVSLFHTRPHIWLVIAQYACLPRACTTGGNIIMCGSYCLSWTIIQSPTWSATWQ